MNGSSFSFQVFSDNGCHRQILSLQVLCLNLDKGCEWIGPLSEIEVSANKHNIRFKNPNWRKADQSVGYLQT